MYSVCERSKVPPISTKSFKIPIKYSHRVDLRENKRKMFHFQSPDDNRLRRRIGIVSFSDTEADTDVDFHRPSGRNVSRHKFYKYGSSNLDM